VHLVIDPLAGSKNVRTCRIDDFLRHNGFGGNAS
jgi:hypothetical protein